MNAMLLCVLAAATQAPAHADPALLLKYINPFQDIVQVKDKTYALLPPELATEGIATDLAWSDDGQTLVFVRHSNRPQFDYNMAVTNSEALNAESVCEWSMANHRAKELLSVDGQTTFVKEIHWLHDSEAILLETKHIGPRGEAPTYSVYRLSGTTDPQGLILNRPDEMKIDVSPTKASAIIQTFSRDSIDGSNIELALLENDGTRLVPIITKATRRGTPLFDGNGDPALLELTTDPATEKRHHFFRPIDLSTGEVEYDALSASQQFFKTPQTDSDISLSKHYASLAEEPKAAANLVSHWVKGTPKSDHPAAFLAPDARESILSPTLRIVAYATSAGLFVRELSPIDLHTINAMIAEDQKEKALEQAQNVGWALIMCSDDSDEMFPGPKSWLETVEPYLKPEDRGSLNGFIYTFTGGGIPQDANVSVIQLGYVLTGTGRAVIYADGVVKWQPN